MIFKKCLFELKYELRINNLNPTMSTGSLVDSLIDPGIKDKTGVRLQRLLFQNLTMLPHNVSLSFNHKSFQNSFYSISYLFC